LASLEFIPKDLIILNQWNWLFFFAKLSINHASNFCLDTMRISCKASRSKPLVPNQPSVKMMKFKKKTKKNFSHKKIYVKLLL
jgi:hypothetical protein